MARAVIFDLDGTLWDAGDKVVPAWNTVLDATPEARLHITEPFIKSLMGKTLVEAAAICMPHLPPERGLEILLACCAEEHRLLYEQGGKVFDGVEAMLKTLSAHYVLGIVSNCQTGYIDTFLTYHKMSGYFADIEEWGRTRLSKGENIRLWMTRNHITEAVYVGDTQGDYEATLLAEVPFVLADYGFGQVPDAQWVAHTPSEVPACVEAAFAARWPQS